MLADAGRITRGIKWFLVGCLSMEVTRELGQEPAIREHVSADPGWGNSSYEH